jgi:hypothetical protein
MGWTIAIIASLLLFYLGKMWFRGIELYNVANNMILAAITYESLSPERRKVADEMLKEVLAANARLRETFEALWQPHRESARWRWYSLAFAGNRIAPAYPEPLGWRPSKNVFRDVMNVHKALPDFEDRLARREVYGKHISWLRIRG